MGSLTLPLPIHLRTQGAQGLAWREALRFNVYRDGRCVARGLSGTSWTDHEARPGTAHVYEVEAVAVTSGHHSHLSEPLRLEAGSLRRLYFSKEKRGNFRGMGAKKVSSKASRRPRRRSSVSTLNMSSKTGPPRTAEVSFGLPPKPMAIRPRPFASSGSSAWRSRSTFSGSPPRVWVCSTPFGRSRSPPMATTR